MANLVVKNIETLEPTRVTADSSTCIDLIAVDKSLDVCHYDVSDFSISDHFPVIARIDISFNSTIKPVFRRSYKHVDFDSLGSEVSSIRLDTIDDPSQLNGQLANWNSQFISILDQVAPVRPFPRSKKKQTWVDSDTRGLMRLRASKAKKLRGSNPLPEDFELVKKLKRCIKSRVRASIKNHGTQILQSQDPREAWKFIKKVTFSESRCSSSLSL